MKICKICNITKNFSCFAIDKVRKSGYRPYCKDCDSIQRKEIRLKRGLKVQISRKNDKNGFKTCSNCKIEKEHLLFDKSKITKDKLTSKCKQCNAEYSKILYKKIKNKAVIFCGRYRRIDEQKNITNDLTPQFLEENILNQPCFYCGDVDIHTGCDRVDNSQGHFKNNVVPCCYLCNSVKSNKFNKEEMLQIGKIISQIKQQRLNNG